MLRQAFYKNRQPNAFSTQLGVNTPFDNSMVLYAVRDPSPTCSTGPSMTPGCALQARLHRTLNGFGGHD